MLFISGYAGHIDWFDGGRIGLIIIIKYDDWIKPVSSRKTAELGLITSSIG